MQFTAELVPPSSSSIRFINILCGFFGSFYNVGLENLPGNLNNRYQFLSGVLLVLQNAGNPVISLTESAGINLQFYLPEKVERSEISILG